MFKNVKLRNHLAMHALVFNFFFQVSSTKVIQNTIGERLSMLELERKGSFWEIAGVLFCFASLDFVFQSY